MMRKLFSTLSRLPVPGMRRLSLQSRFMIYFGSVVVALMAMVILIASHRQWRSVLYQTEQRGIVVANSIAGLASNALLNYDYPTLQKAADETQTETGVAYVIILDKEYVVAGYSDRPELQGQWLSDPVSTKVMENEGPLVQRVLGNSTLPGLDREVVLLDIAAPVHVRGSDARWGTVRIGLSLDAMKEDLASTRRDLALLAFAAVALVLLSARFFTSKITGPLGELAEAAHEIASGRLDHVVDENLVGELGETARSFNKMTSDLRRSRDAIRYQNQHLENMVQERTAALREKARELEKANEELKVVDRLKSDFLSNVSHELRTPLTSIRSFTEIMLDDQMQIDEVERTEFLQIVSSQADRLARLISDLLDLSKIEAGEFHCNLEALPLTELVVYPCIETLRTLAREGDVDLIANLPDDLPQVLGDADRLNQVLTNLLDNALKFTPAGGQVEVTAELSENRVIMDVQEDHFAGMESDTPELGQYIIIRVKDSGCGIEARDQQRIFEKFGQVGNVLTSKPQGTGLGLAISGNIMIQHGGAIWVESQPDHGSSFSFSVPVSMDVTQMAKLEARPVSLRESFNIKALVGAIEHCAAGKKVLVVDDEHRVVQEIAQTLEPLGYRTVGCQGGHQAVAQTRDLHPDVIVLDILMPEINGYDVLRLLKSDPETADIPVVVMGPTEEDQKAYELGAAYHVCKLSSDKELAATLEPAP